LLSYCFSIRLAYWHVRFAPNRRYSSQFNVWLSFHQLRLIVMASTACIEAFGYVETGEVAARIA